MLDQRPPYQLGSQEFSGNTGHYCLSPMKLSNWFLNVFKVDAVIIWPGNLFHQEISLTKKMVIFFFSFLQYIFLT